MSHSNLIIFVITPLMLSIGIVSLLSFDDVFAVSKHEVICIDKVWIESTKGKIACVTPSTAEKLVERGWGTLLDIEKVMEDTSDEKSITPVISGGTLPITETPIIGNPEKEFPKNYVPKACPSPVGPQTFIGKILPNGIP